MYALLFFLSSKKYTLRMDLVRKRSLNICVFCFVRPKIIRPPCTIIILYFLSFRLLIWWTTVQSLWLGHFVLINQKAANFLQMVFSAFCFKEIHQLVLLSLKKIWKVWHYKAERFMRWEFFFSHVRNSDFSKMKLLRIIFIIWKLCL